MGQDEIHWHVDLEVESCSLSLSFSVAMVHAVGVLVWWVYHLGGHCHFYAGGKYFSREPGRVALGIASASRSFSREVVLLGLVILLLWHCCDRGVILPQGLSVMMACRRIVFPPCATHF